MKLIIQIPCLNEEESLPATLKNLPREVPGFDVVEWLVVDDGSADQTVRVATELGVDHIVKHTQNQGLARAFTTGLEACLGKGADVIVNTDADNQYHADDIEKLVEPIVAGRADLVVGARPIESIAHFSPIKKILQKVGSRVVQIASGTKVPDAPSGFRAMSRETAQRMTVFSGYTYTLETIIQAGHKNMAVESVAVRVNEDIRPSRLFSNIPSYIGRSVATVFRIFVVYRPFKFFITMGTILFSAGFILGLRFLYFWAIGQGGGHVQSVVLAGVFLGMGFQTFLIAFVADLLAANRKLLEDIRFRVIKSEDKVDKKSDQ